MKVITISGKAQNGKDTTAGLLKAALEADGYKVLIMLYFYHISCFGRISTQDNCTIQRSKYALSGIGGDIRTVTSFGRSALTIGLGLSHRFWSYSQMSGTMC